ncbi:MAG: antibiotic biosynthesis monooxygenase [Desulfurellaceae bacterium]|nr:antibiotic biosynthesis monooxygenase [Desulfurellaceae bacterium]
MLVVSGTIPIKAESRDEAVQLALDMAKATQAEDGCLFYQFYADLADPNLIRVFEEWESEEALARHMQTDHMATFIKAIPRLVAGPVEAKKYTVSAADPLSA